MGIGCCNWHLKCQTTGKCERVHLLPGGGWSEILGPITDEGVCMLYESTISTPFPLLYALKQKGLITPEQNFLTELGEQYLFQKYWGEKSDIALVLHTIYTLQMVGGGSRIHPRKILEIVKIAKEDVKRW